MGIMQVTTAQKMKSLRTIKALITLDIANLALLNKDTRYE